MLSDIQYFGASLLYYRPPTKTGVTRIGVLNTFRVPNVSEHLYGPEPRIKMKRYQGIRMWANEIDLLFDFKRAPSFYVRGLNT